MSLGLTVTCSHVVVWCFVENENPRNLSMKGGAWSLTQWELVPRLWMLAILPHVRLKVSHPNWDSVAWFSPRLRGDIGVECYLKFESFILIDMFAWFFPPLCLLIRAKPCPAACCLVILHSVGKPNYYHAGNFGTMLTLESFLFFSEIKPPKKSHASASFSHKNGCFGVSNIVESMRISHCWLYIPFHMIMVTLR